MDAAAFLLGEEINNRKVNFILHKGLWDKFHYPSLDLSMRKWKKLKYLNSRGDDFDTTINTVPSNCGGLYIFYVKCEIIKGLTEYPLYIGRAQFTSNQNLRKRVKEYFQKYSKNGERPKIYRMFEYWSKDLYLAYYPLKTNPSIRNIEKKIINSLILPMNDLIPDRKISKSIKAFK